MPKIKVVYHCCDLPGSSKLSIEQISRLLATDLVDHAEIYLCLNGDLTKFLDLVKYVEEYPNVRICHLTDRKDLMEYPTLNFVKELADNSNEEEYILYFHIKGISKLTNQGLQDWRKYMEYWVIDHWRKCIEQLDQGFDTCGTNYIYGSFLGVDRVTRNWPHYSGNFWWARSSYIKKLKRLTHPDDYSMGSVSDLTGYTIDKNTFRFDHEAWIGSRNPKWFEINRSPGGNHDNRGSYPGWHYHHRYSESMYR